MYSAREMRARADGRTRDGIFAAGCRRRGHKVCMNVLSYTAAGYEITRTELDKALSIRGGCAG